MCSKPSAYRQTTFLSIDSARLAHRMAHSEKVVLSNILSERRYRSPILALLLNPPTPPGSACRNSRAVSLLSLPNCYPLLPTLCNSRYSPIPRFSYALIVLLYYNYYSIIIIIGQGLDVPDSVNPCLTSLCLLTILTYHTILTIWDFILKYLTLL